MKLYLAGPMTGYPEMNYPAFRTIGSALEGAGYAVLNPVNVDREHVEELIEQRAYCSYCEGQDGGKHPWKWYMLRTLQMLSGAEGLAVMPHWEQSKGARIEVGFATGMEIPVAQYGLWIDRKATMLRGEWGR